MFGSICDNNQHFDDAIAEREWLQGRGGILGSSLNRPKSKPMPKLSEDMYFYPDFIWMNGKTIKIKYKRKN